MINTKLFFTLLFLSGMNMKISTVKHIILFVLFLLCSTGFRMSAQEMPVLTEGKEIYPGVWRYTIGTPDKITPVSTRGISPDEKGLSGMASAGRSPIVPQGEITDRGVIISVPLNPDELIYGLGLQMQSFQQRGSKKLLRVNADPTINSGDSHAPVPFYVTTDGYGVLIDNARYMTFYLGNKKKKPEKANQTLATNASEDGWNALNGPYERLGLGPESEVLVEIPHSKGVDVYIFAGPSMKEAIARYNLFSGGGNIPPRWGLGFWYRVHSDYTQEQMLKLADEFRSRNMPCDVLGLEPHWQTNSYSSSYVWSSRFPSPAQMLSDLKMRNFRVNMWMQAFVHPKSPIYDALLPWSGDYEVWDGIVPDFITPEAKRIFIDYQKKTNVDIGIAGFKADECDNSDFTGYWSFPELSRFPSGADGEQMHSLFGLRYQDAIMTLFSEKQQRTYNLVRNSGALAAPYPFVLYSDLYDHQTFINSVAQSGFCGLLWTPEVRHAVSEEDLLRRLQTVIFSPLSMINAWYLQMPPWKQMDRQLNNQYIIADNASDLEEQCRKWISLRMELVPYLHAAFVKYKKEGIPPFRALIVDFPEEKEALKDLRGQFMMGDYLMVAPVTANGRGIVEKNIYFPSGKWYDFFTGESIEGGRNHRITVPLDRMPVYVKEGTLLPLAKVTNSTEDKDSRLLTVRAYGDVKESFVLYEDDGSWDVSLQKNEIIWNTKQKKASLKSNFYKLEDTVIIK